MEGVWVGGVSGSSAATSAMCLVVQPLREKCACETDTAKKAFLQTTLVSTASIHMHGSVCMWGETEGWLLDLSRLPSSLGWAVLVVSVRFVS